MMATQLQKKQRLKIIIKGVVQGVGFRPYIYKTAVRLGLTGKVLNLGGELHIETQGDLENIKKFIESIKVDHPKKASIINFEVSKIPISIGEDDFKIAESRKNDLSSINPSADLAICGDCNNELFNKDDRRYMHPFISCTNCGPRFSIINKMPYDRQNTTMEDFLMCRECGFEYKDLFDRRFHSQPNSCKRCGPRVHLYSYYHPDLRKIIAEKDNGAFENVAHLIRNNGIALIKGIGGYHLACISSSDRAVSRIRNLKNRPHKPLAVMVSELKEANNIAFINQYERRALMSNNMPIVLLKPHSSSKISNLVISGSGKIGVMLAYTPIHKILLKLVGEPLVMTSGNTSGSPIEYESSKAFKNFAKEVDIIVDHNRRIYNPIDDSVTHVIRKKNVVIRRARGFVPEGINLSMKTRPTLACGADMKSSFAISIRKTAYLSQYNGDLSSMDNFERYKENYLKFADLFDFTADVVAYDLHPQYVSSQLAKRLNSKTKIAVQHHHAHIVSCMEEHNINQTVIGVAFDGTGYGTDGNIWGGEFLLSNKSKFQRVAHLRYMPMPGGDICVNNTYRMAIAVLNTYGLSDLIRQTNLPVNELEYETIQKQISSKINMPITSSMGRLFDGVSAMLGICTSSTYEGQAAVELEAVASSEYREKYPFKIDENDGIITINYAGTLEGIISDLKSGLAIGDISAKFHNTVASTILLCCSTIRSIYGTNKVVLSGGVFQNKRLLTYTDYLLTQSSFEVFFNEKVPSNDGGIALGQLIIANSKCA